MSPEWFSPQAAEVDRRIMEGPEAQRAAGREPAYDRLRNGFRRATDLAPVVGLFEGNYCRRCRAVFPALVPEEDPRPDGGEPRMISGQEAHRLWHEWRDQQANVLPASADEWGFYSALELKPQDSSRADVGTPLPLPSRLALEKHREAFMPKRADTAVALRRLKALHGEAVDFFTTFGISEDDARNHVLELRSQGRDEDEISDATGIPLRAVAVLVGGVSE